MKFLPFIWRQLARNKLRTALTAGAIGLAVSLVCLLLTMPAGLDALLSDVASNTRIVVHNEAGLVYPLPYAYLQKIRAQPGVVSAASWTWYGGVFREEKGVEFPNFAVEPDPLGSVWADWNLDPQQLEAFRRHRDGAIVGRGTLLKNGWKIGDRITLKGTIYPVDLSFLIVGEIASERAPHFWFQREYLDQALRAAGRGGLDILGTVWVRVDDPARVAPLMREIDELFHNSEAVTASETEKSYFANFFSMLEGFVTVILIVTGLVALCIVFIAANTASMAVRERLGEIAVLKALGFSRRLIFGTLLTEAVLLATLGGALGALGALGLTQLLRSGGGWNPALGPLGSFIVTQTILVQGLFLALFVGMISGVVPALGAARRSVAETLREVF
ncbi:MAG: FtsX-like permease family protein [Deltaproteobacteria bacterium]|nr:FtsX-like permease family protein [Deltaproteobacteria bacterium]